MGSVERWQIAKFDEFSHQLSFIDKEIIACFKKLKRKKYYQEFH